MSYSDAYCRAWTAKVVSNELRRARLSLARSSKNIDRSRSFGMLAVRIATNSSRIKEKRSMRSLSRWRSEAAECPLDG
jgi:hypothetical protein